MEKNEKEPLKANSYQGEPADDDEVKHCSICTEPFVEPSCSSRPINEGRCCWRCDDLIITPTRIVEAQDAKAGLLMADAIRRGIDMREGKRIAAAASKKGRKKR